MTTDLATVPGLTDMLAGGSVPAPMSEDMRERAQASAFLPILAIVQGTSKVSGPPHNYRLGTWALRLGTDNYDNFGGNPDLDAIVLDAREKALYIDKQNNVESNFEPLSARYAEIKAIAEAGGAKDGYTWGYDILLLLRDGRFVNWFCNNATLRRVCKTEYPPLFDMMQKGVTLTPKYISKDGRNWYGCTVKPCSSFEAIPATRERLLAVITEFKNPGRTAPASDDVQDAAPAKTLIVSLLTWHPQCPLPYAGAVVSVRSNRSGSTDKDVTVQIIPIIFPMINWLGIESVCDWKPIREIDQRHNGNASSARVFVDVLGIKIGVKAAFTHMHIGFVVKADERDIRAIMSACPFLAVSLISPEVAVISGLFVNWISLRDLALHSPVNAGLLEFQSKTVEFLRAHGLAHAWDQQ